MDSSENSITAVPLKRPVLGSATCIYINFGRPMHSMQSRFICASVVVYARFVTRTIDDIFGVAWVRELSGGGPTRIFETINDVWGDVEGIHTR